jgi:threonine dehydrogenase-like Zn-dependent dehydrogenase
MDKNITVTLTAKQKMELVESEIPALENQEVLVKTECSLISIGTEMTAYSGDYPEGSAWDKFSTYPRASGYSNVGTIVDAGKEVDRSIIGSRIATNKPHSRFVKASFSQAMVPPDSLSSEEATFFRLAQVALNGIRRGETTWGETAVVFGLGIIGQMTVQLLNYLGCWPVFACDIDDFRLGKLPKAPAIQPLNPEKEDLHKAIKEKTNGRMADIAFELTGVGSLIPAELTVLRKMGRFIVVSSPRGNTNINLHDLCNGPSYAIVGAHSNSHPEHETPHNPWTRTRHTELLFDLLTAGVLDFRSLITHRKPYTEAPHIYRRLLADRKDTLGIILQW